VPGGVAVAVVLERQMGDWNTANGGPAEWPGDARQLGRPCALLAWEGALGALQGASQGRGAAGGQKQRACWRAASGLPESLQLRLAHIVDSATGAGAHESHGSHGRGALLVAACYRYERTAGLEGVCRRASRQA